MEFTIFNKHLGRVVVHISEEDADLADQRWHLSGGKPRPGAPAWYVTNNDHEYLHRIVAFRMGLIPGVRGGQGGKWTESIDHANGDKLDNQRTNLRLRSRVQQMTNENDPLRRNNTSGSRGVSYVASRRSHKKWYANVMVNGRTKAIGYYETQEEAVAARASFLSET